MRLVYTIHISSHDMLMNSSLTRALNLVFSVPDFFEGRSIVSCITYYVPLKGTAENSLLHTPLC